jgi:hypothetical protein
LREQRGSQELSGAAASVAHSLRHLADLDCRLEPRKSPRRDSDVSGGDSPGVWEGGAPGAPGLPRAADSDRRPLRYTGT